MRTRGINVHRYCEGFGIKVRPVSQAVEQRPLNTIYGGRIIARMLRRMGPDHTGLVLMCIQASDPACLYGDTLYAVSRFIRAHRNDRARRAATIIEFRAVGLPNFENALSGLLWAKCK